MSLIYSCTALQGTNKVGKLTPDANGYYRLCLGGLNIMSSGGRFYSLERNRAIFEGSSAFMRRMRDGNLYSEDDHPAQLPGMSDDEYVARICFIESNNVCAHIKQVELVPGETNSKGEQIHYIYGLVKPDRAKGHLLKAALDNPDQNVCFSLRALCEDQLIGGRWVRTITDLITFDWVIEPGLPVATKYRSAGLESFSRPDMPISREILEKVISNAESGKVALESNRLEILKSALAATQSTKINLARPAISRWK